MLQDVGMVLVTLQELECTPLEALDDCSDQDSLRPTRVWGLGQESEAYGVTWTALATCTTRGAVTRKYTAMTDHACCMLLTEVLSYAVQEVRPHSLQ